MIAVASGWIANARLASYQASGFMWFSGVSWSKCRRTSAAGEPAVSRESTATPMLKSTVSLIGVRSSMSGSSSAVTTTSSTRKLADVPSGHVVSK